MLISLFANIGALLIAAYMIIIISEGDLDYYLFSLKEITIYSAITVIAGCILMGSAIVVNGARYDLRFILLALALNFLGMKTTVISFSILTILRFFFSGWLPSLLSGFNYILLCAILYFLYPAIQKIPNRILRLGLLTMLSLTVSLPSSIYLIQDIDRAFYIYGYLFFIGLIVSTISGFFIRGLIDVVSKIDIDELTQLHNSRKFNKDALAYDRIKKEYGILVIDIDKFKSINDRYGHLMGNRVLETVGRTMNQYANHERRFYRFGGEEFVAIVTEEHEAILQLADVISNKIKSQTFYTEEYESFNVTVSIGVAFYKAEDITMKVLDRADKALYQAKNAGRDKVVVADE